MGETEVKRGGGLGFPQWKKNVRRRKSFDPSFLVQLHNNLQNSLKTQLKRFGKKDLGAKLGRNEKGCSDLMRVDLESQLQAWRENPSWTDPPPEIKVSVPKGSLCNLDVKVDVGLPPRAVYNIVTDPDNRRVFKNIKEVISRRVLVDEGERQVVEVEQAALWNFLWWSGTISVHVLVDQSRQDHTMKFKQLNTGIMKKFEGFWRVEPVFVDENICYPCKPKTWADYCSCTGGKGRVGSRVSLEQIIQPAIVPPPPISWYMRGITIKTTEMIANYLLDEAARIRGGKDYLQKEEPDTSATANEQDTQQNVEFCDIKERWALHRRRTRKHNQKFSTAK